MKKLIIRGRNLNRSLISITQSYFLVPKDVTSTHYLIMKIHYETGLQNIATNHSADNDYKDFMKIYKKYASKSYVFLTINAILSSDYLLRFKKNVLELL